MYFFFLFIAEAFQTDQQIGSSILMSKINPGTGLYTGPYLESHEVTNVTTQIGTHAYLPCKVSSWMYSKQK